MAEKLKVYISFAEEDRSQVRGLESKLRKEGFDTWFDERDLTAGSDWREEIQTALPLSDVFLSCISTRSIRRRGFYDEEIAMALDLRKGRPGFVIPARLDECELPNSLAEAHLTWVDVFTSEGLERLVRDLRQRSESRKALSSEKALIDSTPLPPKLAPNDFIRILHLTDLHFTGEVNHDQLLNILDDDLEDLAVDYLVVSGDLSDKCNAEGYEKAAKFLNELQSRKSIGKQNCILTPGNHDVQRSLDIFEIRDKTSKGDDAVPVLAGALDTKLHLVRKATSYADRFKLFADVHKDVTGKDFDVTDPAKQFCVEAFHQDQIIFLGLNSAWQIDQFRPKRSSIHIAALENGIRLLKQQSRGYLGIAVWHHAITGNDKIASDEFLGRLSRAGVRLCFHGDVHELRPDIVSPYSSARIHVLGAGSLAAAASDRPESTPRMYNLVEIHRDRTRARVSMRQQPKAGVQFQPYATWSVPGQRDVRSGRYEFALDGPIEDS